MAGNRYQRDPKTGRFAPTGDSIEDTVNISAADVRPGMAVPRHAPEADDLAQGGQWSPLRARNPVMVHPDDEGFHNAILRTAARDSGPGDPTAALVGLDTHGTHLSGVTVRDGG